jgi:hypothetical protein
VLIGILFLYVEPKWFNPPVWLRIMAIVLFAPYLACVFGIIGIGNTGRSGFSPWKDFKYLIHELRRD